MEPGELTLRVAVLGDCDAIERLIERSIRALGRDDYTPEQIDGALQGAFGLDTQLIEDRSYFVVEASGRIVASGGWSFRRTLFGSDSADVRDAARLDPAVDAAKVRAFFVDPDFARRGIGTMLLDRCEVEAKQAGFRRAELMATLPGVRLYRARGYRGDVPIAYDLPGGGTITFVPMEKPLD